MYGSLLQCVAVQEKSPPICIPKCAAVFCSLVQSGAVWCSVFSVTHCSVLQCAALCCSVLQVCCSEFKRVVVYCSVLQRVAVCCSVLNSMSVCPLHILFLSPQKCVYKKNCVSLRYEYDRYIYKKI